jgi:hypothetical protein
MLILYHAPAVSGIKFESHESRKVTIGSVGKDRLVGGLNHNEET